MIRKRETVFRTRWFEVELPSGLVDRGDDAQATARRELEEETGHRVGELQHLGTLYSEPPCTLPRCNWWLRALDTLCIRMVLLGDQQEAV